MVLSFLQWKWDGSIPRLLHTGWDSCESLSHNVLPLSSWLPGIHSNSFFFFFRPSICYRFYRTGLALYMHIYYLWVLHLWMWKQMYLKAFKSHDLGAGWLFSRQKYSLHPMATSTMGPKHPCTEFCGRSLVWCFLDSPQPALLGIFCLKLGFTYLTLGHLQQVASSHSPLGFV